MSVIAVVNRKGGSGKSTLATHIAAYCALRGATVALGDIDRQQSTRTWLRQRKMLYAQAGEGMHIVGWHIDARSFVRPPTGIDHVVIDTPGGLTGLDLARVVMYADAIVVPVGLSIFDRESAAACLAELRTLPRVSSGRCRLAAIGMRVESRSDAADVLLAWSEEQHLRLVAVLPQSHAYVRCIDQGLTLFDMPLSEIESDLDHWKPLVQWLRPLVRPAANASEAAPGTAASLFATGSGTEPVVDQPKPGTLQPGAIPLAAAGAGPDRSSDARRGSVEAATPARGRLFGALAIPGFLHRRS
jgi:chromosome partitioning protein